MLIRFKILYFITQIRSCLDGLYYKLDAASTWEIFVQFLNEGRRNIHTMLHGTGMEAGERQKHTHDPPWNKHGSRRMSKGYI